MKIRTIGIMFAIFFGIFAMGYMWYLCWLSVFKPFIFNGSEYQGFTLLNFNGVGELWIEFIVFPLSMIFMLWSIISFIGAKK